MSTNQANRVFSLVRRLAIRDKLEGETDAQLLERFLARREESAFEELVGRHGSMVFGVCLRVLREPNDAADAFQATFLVLVRKASSIVPRSHIRPWLYGVARRTALKARSLAARRLNGEQQAARRRPLVAGPVNLDCDLRPLLDEELDRLPEKYRVPILLCLLDGKSRKEAAGQLGWSEGTLSGRLARAKELLGTRLRRRGVTLTALGLAAALAEGASAKVPASLALATIKTATSLAGPTRTGSVHVFALMEEVMKAMLISKLKAAVGVLLLLAGLGAGAVFACQYGPPSPSAPSRPDADAKAVEMLEKAPKAKAAKVRDYIIEPPDVLLVKYASADGADPVKIDGQRLVRPDGTIGLGQLGSVIVSGRTLTDAHVAIASHLTRRLDGFDSKKLIVELITSNSKVFYVIKASENNNAVYRFPAVDNQKVLDAILGANVSLIGLGQKRISLHRMTDEGKSSQTLPVDCEAIMQRGNTSTNYILQPGDRLYIEWPEVIEGNGLKAGAIDPIQDLETIVKAFREARSPEEQQRVLGDLDLLVKKLRK